MAIGVQGLKPKSKSGIGLRLREVSHPTLTQTSDTNRLFCRGGVRNQRFPLQQWSAKRFWFFFVRYEADDRQSRW